ncbi:MAG: 50S ribosomal protein L11 methyltransferase [Gammaproteobacteria bacterium]|nr:50S ribosomal protein L11 methyltransferase [Gammaproteobacteria bacterium]
MFDFYEISTCCTTDRVAEVEDELNRASAFALSFRDGAETKSAPTFNTVWVLTQITALLPKQTNLYEIEAALSNLGCHSFCARTLEESEWSQHLNQPAFKLIVGPFVIGDPQPSTESRQIPLEISAGLAFGTGAHETTALCLEWLASHDLRGKHVLDLGCGSGILAIAAMKLGAASSIAIDNDQTACDVAKENAAKNKVEISVSNRLELESKFDVVVCNIYADTLIQYAEQIEYVLDPSARLALSGILESQIEQVKRSYLNVKLDSVQIRNDWVLLAGIKH